MTKPSNIWSRLAASSLLFISGAAFAATSPAQIDPLALQSAKDAAALSGATASGQYSSRETFKTNLVEPTTSPVPMKTMDGVTSFDAQLSFPSTRTFLELFVQPSATGDLSTVIAGQDLNLDGTIDASYQVPVPVSGICANGLISCSPGTWTGCSYYRWAASAQGQLSLTNTSLLNLGGCYCINASCGSDLTWSNLSFILKDLGGGAVGEIQASNPSFSISSVAITGTTIFYSGQDSSRSAETIPGGNSTPPAQSAYYSSPLSISGEVQGALLAQSNDPQSLYSLVTNIDPQKQQNTCVDKRIVSLYKPDINEIIEPVGGTGTIQYCGVDCIDIILGKTAHNRWSGNCTIYEEDYRVLLKQPDLIASATLVKTIYDDYMQVWVDGTKVWYGPNANFPPETAGRCENSTDGQATPNLDVTPTFKRNGEVSSKIRVSVGGKGDGYAQIRIKLKLNECAVLESTQDGCSSINSRTECRLQEEMIDGVSIVRNANPTGLVVLPSTKTIRENTCNDVLLTRDWWERKKVFLCDTGGYDFSDVKKRFGTVVDSMRTTGTVTDYRDTIKSSSGNWSESLGALTQPAADPVSDCELACKTRKAKVDSQANLLGTSSQHQADTQSYDIIYRTCDKNGLCPAESGEEIIKGCQCLNEFNEAASMMQMLRLGGQDAICTTGEEKTLK